jgi:hypothetical protein
MFKNILVSEKGFGLVHVLAALIIVSVSVGGLFMISVIARVKAVENYHYRSALLVAAGKMELLKYKNRDVGNGHVNVHNVPAVFNEVVIDEGGGTRMVVSVVSPYPFVETQSDIQVAPYVMYERVKLRVKWTEPNMMFLPRRTRYITLYEDYFRRNE